MPDELSLTLQNKQLYFHFPWGVLAVFSLQQSVSAAATPRSQSAQLVASGSSRWTSETAAPLQLFLSHTFTNKNCLQELLQTYSLPRSWDRPTFLRQQFCPMVSAVSDLQSLCLHFISLETSSLPYSWNSDLSCQLLLPEIFLWMTHAYMHTQKIKVTQEKMHTPQYLLISAPSSWLRHSAQSSLSHRHDKQEALAHKTLLMKFFLKGLFFNKERLHWLVQTELGTRPGHPLFTPQQPLYSLSPASPLLSLLSLCLLL